jgi:hypothetical protein
MDEIKTQRQFDISNMYDKLLTDFMNAEQRYYTTGVVHISETPQCPRQAITNNFFTTKFETLNDFLEMWIGKGCHSFLPEIIPRGYPEQTYSKIFKYNINGEILKVEVEGTIDLETRRGIYEAKTTGTFLKLMKYDPDLFPQFNFDLVEWYRSDKPYRNTKNRGPQGSHLDQSNGYLVITNRSVYIVLYFSKIQNEGIAAYKVKFDPKDLDDRETRKKNRVLLRERVGVIALALRTLSKVPEEDYETISKIINKAKAETSGICQYCMFGGYRDAKKIRGRKNIDELSGHEKFFAELIPGEKYFTKGCNVHIKERGETGKRWKQPIFGLPKLKQDASGNIIDGFIYDAKIVDKLYDKIAEFVANNIFIPYDVKNLFECPRRANYINKYPDLETLLKSNFETKRRMVWYWIWENIKRYFLFSISNELLEEDALSVEEEKKHYEVILKLPTESGIEDVKKVYTERVFFIDGIPTIVVPTTEVYHSSIPFIQHKQRLLLYKEWYPDSDVRVVYIPIRKPSKHEDDFVGKNANTNVFSVRRTKNFDRTDFLLFLKNKVRDIESDKPVAMLWCTWCPILGAELPDGRVACPEGKEFVRNLYSKKTTSTSTSEKGGVVIRSVKKSTISPYGDDPSELYETEDLSQMTW